MYEQANILVVDDDQEIGDLIEIYLKNEGFSVYKAEDGRQALEILKEKPVSLVVLDIMMPNMDGIAFCKAAREISDIPIIMLSAKSQDIDKITGLMTGADDYVTKPFNPFELIARIKSQLRRYGGFQKPQSADVIEYNGLCINRAEHKVTLYGKEVPLTPTEFEILYLLVSGNGKVFSSEEIFEKVWKEKYYDATNTVMVHIRHIREKLGDTSKNPVFIKTVWGVGYKV
ncbi:MAG TPA: response regulator transcription factor [Clostridiales bacterium]|nr:response regulator transcription factor [Clostridiales bacterium]